MAAIGPRSAGPPGVERARSPGHPVTRTQLRSARGVGAGAADLSVDDMSVVVVVDVAAGAVLFSVAFGSVVLLDIVLVSAGVDWVVVVDVVVVSVDCATAAPIPASRAAEAATADNFFW